MSPFRCLPSLFLCLAASLAALPARADMASPQEDIRQAKVAQWHQRYPGTVPALDLALSPDGASLAVRFTARTPADYSISLNGKDAAQGKLADLKGGVQTQTIALTKEAGRQGEWLVHADFTLRGVQAKGGTLAETGERIAGCLRKHFEIVETGGKPVLNELGLDGGDYFILRRCGL